MYPYPLSFVFIIFFVTLGPLKTMPVFFMLTHEAGWEARRYLALRSFLLATFIVLAIAFIFLRVLAAWHISLPALQIAGGVLLFVSATLIVLQFREAKATPAPKEGHGRTRPSKEQLNHLAISPLAVPAIVTPFGVVAILIFMGSAKGDLSAAGGVLGLLLLTMALNLGGMLVAAPVIRWAGVASLQIVGWIMAVLQAGLAVQVILGALRKLEVLA